MKEKTPKQLLELDDKKLNRYFGKVARRLPQAVGSGEPYYVQVGARTVWGKTPKALYSKFKAAVKKAATIPAKATKRDRHLVTLLTLPVRKVGEDLRSRMNPRRGRKPKLHVALDRYAADLVASSERVRALSAYLADKQGVTVFADTTIVQIDGPASVLKPLVKQGLLHLDEVATKEANGR